MTIKNTFPERRVFTSTYLFRGGISKEFTTSQKQGSSNRIEINEGGKYPTSYTPSEQAKRSPVYLEEWTTERLIDELHYHLESYEDENRKRKYEEHSKYLLYRIPVYSPVPHYVVSQRDLTAKLKEELKNYDVVARQDILKTAVGRVFENINRRYFIQSVKRLLTVELKD